MLENAVYLYVLNITYKEKSYSDLTFLIETYKIRVNMFSFKNLA